MKTKLSKAMKTTSFSCDLTFCALNSTHLFLLHLLSPTWLLLTPTPGSSLGNCMPACKFLDGIFLPKAYTLTATHHTMLSTHEHTKHNTYNHMPCTAYIQHMRTTHKHTHMRAHIHTQTRALAITHSLVGLLGIFQFSV